MKKFTLFFFLFSPLIVFSQGVKIQFGTTNTATALTNIIKSIATNAVVESGVGGSTDWVVITNKPASILLVSTNDGSTLTNLNASNLASGTVPSDRIGPTFSNLPIYYVDSVSGSDANHGRTPQAAWQTIARLSNTLNSVEIRLARGSHWREQLSLGTNCVVRDYGAGPRPILDGSEMNASWSLVSGKTFTYAVSNWVATVGGGATSISVIEDGIILRRTATMADVETTAGSFYADLNPLAGSTNTVYLHPTSSGDPTANSRRYEVTKRNYALTASHNTSVINLVTRNAMHNNGSLELQRNAYVSGVLAENGTKHNFYFASGVVEDSEFMRGGQHPDGSIPVVAYDTVDGGQVVFRRVRVGGTKDQIVGSAFYGHTGGTQGTFLRATFEDCEVSYASGFGSISINTNGVQIFNRCKARGITQTGWLVYSGTNVFIDSEFLTEPATTFAPGGGAIELRGAQATYFISGLKTVGANFAIRASTSGSSNSITILNSLLSGGNISATAETSNNVFYVSNTIVQANTPISLEAANTLSANSNCYPLFVSSKVDGTTYLDWPSHQAGGYDSESTTNDMQWIDTWSYADTSPAVTNLAGPGWFDSPRLIGIDDTTSGSTPGRQTGGLDLLGRFTQATNSLHSSKLNRTNGTAQAMTVSGGFTNNTAAARTVIASTGNLELDLIKAGAGNSLQQNFYAGTTLKARVSVDSASNFVLGSQNGNSTYLDANNNTLYFRAGGAGQTPFVWYDNSGPVRYWMNSAGDSFFPNSITITNSSETFAGNGGGLSNAVSFAGTNGILITTTDGGRTFLVDGGNAGTNGGGYSTNVHLIDASVVSVVTTNGEGVWTLSDSYAPMPSSENLTNWSSTTVASVYTLATNAATTATNSLASQLDSVYATDAALTAVAASTTNMVSLTVSNAARFTNAIAYNLEVVGSGSKWRLVDYDSSTERGWIQQQADGTFQVTFNGSSLTNIADSALSDVISKLGQTIATNEIDATFYGWVDSKGSGSGLPGTNTVIAYGDAYRTNAISIGKNGVVLTNGIGGLTFNNYTVSFTDTGDDVYLTKSGAGIVVNSTASPFTSAITLNDGGVTAYGFTTAGGTFTGNGIGLTNVFGSMSALEASVGGANILTAAEVDSSAEVLALMSDENTATGTPVLFSGTLTSPQVGDQLYFSGTSAGFTNKAPSSIGVSVIGTNGLGSYTNSGVVYPYFTGDLDYLTVAQMNVQDLWATNLYTLQTNQLLAAREDGKLHAAVIGAGLSFDGTNLVNTGSAGQTGMKTNTFTLFSDTGTITGTVYVAAATTLTNASNVIKGDGSVGLTTSGTNLVANSVSTNKIDSTFYDWVNSQSAPASGFTNYDYDTDIVKLLDTTGTERVQWQRGGGLTNFFVRWASGDNMIVAAEQPADPADRTLTLYSASGQATLELQGNTITMLGDVIANGVWWTNVQTAGVTNYGSLRNEGDLAVTGTLDLGTVNATTANLGTVYMTNVTFTTSNQFHGAFVGNGAGVTNLNAANLAAGGTLPALNANALTNIAFGSLKRATNGVADATLIDLRNAYCATQQTANLTISGFTSGSYDTSGTNVMVVNLVITNNSSGAKTISVPVSWQDISSLGTIYNTNIGMLNVMVYPGFTTNYAWMGK